MPPRSIVVLWLALGWRFMAPARSGLRPRHRSRRGTRPARTEAEAQVRPPRPTGWSSKATSRPPCRFTGPSGPRGPRSAIFVTKRTPRGPSAAATSGSATSPPRSTAWTAAIALDARRQDPGFEGYDWLLIGTVEFRRQRSREALEALSKAVPLLGTAGDREHEADARLLLAKALRDLGRFAETIPHLDRVLELADALDDPKIRTDAWAQSGSVALETEEPELAVEWLSDARDAYAELGHIAEAAEADRLLGDAFLRARPARRGAGPGRGRRRARTSGSTTLSAWRTTSNSSPPSRPTPRTCPRHGRWPCRAVAARRDGDDPAGEIDARVQLAHFDSLANDWRAAADTLNVAVNLVLVEGEPAAQVRLLILAADVDTRAGLAPRSRTRLDKAAQIADHADNGALRALVAAARKRTPR